MKGLPEKAPSVRFSDAVTYNGTQDVVYDNPVKQSIPKSGNDEGGSVVRIKRNPQDGSFYMRSDGKVKYVFR